MVEFDAGGNRTLDPPARFLVVGIVGPSAARSRRRRWAGRRERDARRKPTADVRYFYVRYSSSNRAMSHRAMSHRVRRRRRVHPLRRGNRRTRRRRRRGRTGTRDTRDTRADGRDGRASLPPRRRSLELPPRFRRERSDGGSLNSRSLSEPRGVARELPIVHLRVETALRVVGWVNAVRYAVRYVVQRVPIVDSRIVVAERDRARPVPLPQPPKLRDARDLRPAARVLAGGTVLRGRRRSTRSWVRSPRGSNSARPRRRTVLVLLLVLLLVLASLARPAMGSHRAHADVVAVTPPPSCVTPCVTKHRRPFPRGGDELVSPRSRRRRVLGSLQRTSHGLVPSRRFVFTRPFMKIIRRDVPVVVVLVLDGADGAAPLVHRHGVQADAVAVVSLVAPVAEHELVLVAAVAAPPAQDLLDVHPVG